MGLRVSWNENVNREAAKYSEGDVGLGECE